MKNKCNKKKGVEKLVCESKKRFKKIACKRIPGPVRALASIKRETKEILNGVELIRAPFCKRR